MYHVIETPKYRCSKCESTNIYTPANIDKSGWGDGGWESKYKELKCLDCGHTSEKPKATTNINENDSTMWTYTTSKKDDFRDF